MHDYIYLSTRRLKDLSDQLPAHSLGKIEAGLEGSILGLLKATLKSERSTAEPSVFDLLSRVEDALRREGKIGGIGAKSEWLEGNLTMYWGNSNYASSSWNEFSPVVFFGGTRGCQAVLLGGSGKHLRSSSESDSPSTSDLPEILAGLASKESDMLEPNTLQNLSEEDIRVYDAIDYCHGNWGGTPQTVSFLAKRLLTRDDVELGDERWRVTIGAPLYVRT